ncbi:MAG: InlB B-repeat-containing protein [Clostridia bacterium]|nr:InlB B-repeat-containing protein [Clostridia bacterium]
MNKISRKVFSSISILALFVCVFLIPMTVYADTYNLFVGGTQVTSENKDDVLGDGKVTYNPTTQTLDFDDVTINDYHIQWDNDKCGIFSQGIDLTITGELTIDRTDLWNAIGIYNFSGETMNGTINADVTFSNTIYVQGNLTIAGGSLTKTTNGSALLATESLTIESNVTRIDVMSYISGYEGITIEEPLAITSPEGLTITNGETTSIGSASAYDTTRIIIEEPQITHTVTFMDGETVLSSEQVVDGEKATKPATPTKTGYTFGDWYTDATLTTVFNFNDTITKDTTIYSRWRENVSSLSATFPWPIEDQHPTQVATGETDDSSKYTITTINFYDTDNTPLTANDTFEAGKTYRIFICLTPTINFSIPTTATAQINGEDASYWTAISDGKGTKVFYVYYTIPIKYTVSFMDGESVLTTLQVIEGEKATKPATSPIKNGYTFDNWYADVQCQNLFDFENTVINSNISIYAKWNQINMKPHLEKQSDGKYYYIKDGVKTKATLLFRHTDGKWYYVKSGVVTKSTLLFKHTDGKYYYIKNGVKTNATLLFKHTDKKYYYVKNGVVTKSTLLFKHSDGKWYFIKNGVVTKSTLLFKHTNGKWYYIKNGVMTKATLLFKHTDNKYYYIKNGVMTKATLVYKFNGKSRYIKNGVWQSSFSGKVKISGKNYTIKKGNVA